MDARDCTHCAKSRPHPVKVMVCEGTMRSCVWERALTLHIDPNFGRTCGPNAQFWQAKDALIP